MIHVGQALPDGGGTSVVLAARAIEDAGLDGAWCGDHLSTSHSCLDSATVLGAAAAVTERITVGWSVLVSALRPAAWAAKQVATVQQISGGRLQLGVGLGRPGAEWRMAGTGTAGRGARTDAFLRALPDLLAGRPADPSPDGSLPDVVLSPAVPAPPLWIGGESDTALRRAVRFDAGWLAPPLPPHRLVARIRDFAALTDPGRPALRVAAGVLAAPGQDVDTTVRQISGAFGFDPHTAAALAVCGGPRQLADGLAAYRDTGADTLVVVPIGTDPISTAELLGKARALL